MSYDQISWKDKMTNEQVLEIVKEKRTLKDVIRSRKKKSGSDVC